MKNVCNLNNDVNHQQISLFTQHTLLHMVSWDFGVSYDEFHINFARLYCLNIIEHDYN